MKLASDTVRAAGEGNDSAAADVWALGVTLCEALARRRPSGLEGAGPIEPPSELPASFREIVARCLSRDPQERPKVSELQSWLRGEPSEPSAQTSATRLVIRVELPPGEEPEDTDVSQRASWRPVPLAIAAVVLVALGWGGYRMFVADPPQSGSIAEERLQEAPPESPGSTAAPTGATASPRTPAPSGAIAPASPPATRSAAVTQTSRAASVSDEPPPPPPEPDASSAINEVIPDVPRSALQTIRGTVRVSIRVIVNQDGTVLAATPENPGPSRYFERLSLDASKKWTFAPADTEGQRLMLLRFNFTRAGATASAKPVG